MELLIELIAGLVAFFVSVPLFRRLIFRGERRAAARDKQAARYG